MIINMQAFNARGKDARRIYEELDDFQSRRPIDVIRRNRPIMILDEPQKMEGAKTVEGQGVDALFVLRYSATHVKSTTRCTGWTRWTPTTSSWSRRLPYAA